jgi:hypothetical protein
MAMTRSTNLGGAWFPGITCSDTTVPIARA